MRLRNTATAAVHRPTSAPPNAVNISPIRMALPCSRNRSATCWAVAVGDGGGTNPEIAKNPMTQNTIAPKPPYEQIRVVVVDIPVTFPCCSVANRVRFAWLRRPALDQPRHGAAQHRHLVLVDDLPAGAH